MAGELYLVLNAGDDAAQPAAAAGALAAALSGGPVASVLLRATHLSDPLQRRWIDALRPVAQEGGCAFLIEDRPDLASELGCDGVHLTLNELAVAFSRRALGSDMIVGALCGRSRHRAMTAGEQGADYVGFALGEEDRDGEEDETDGLGLLAWWQEMMTLPCVAFGARDLQDGLRQMRAGADFLALDRPVWDDPRGPEAAVRDITERLRRL